MAAHGNSTAAAELSLCQLRKKKKSCSEKELNSALGLCPGSNQVSSV